MINAFLDNSLNLIRDLKPRRRTRFSRQLKSCLVARQDGRCAYCGIELHTRGRERNLSIDHKHPVSAVGTNEKSNLQAICRQCNNWKDDHTDEEFEERIKRGRKKLGISRDQPMNPALLAQIINCTGRHESADRRKVNRFRKATLKVATLVAVLFLCVFTSTVFMVTYRYPMPLEAGAVLLNEISTLFACALLNRAWNRGYLRWRPYRKGVQTR